MSSSPGRVDDFQQLQVGVFYADNDHLIACRIQDKISNLGCKVELCDFFDGGNPKLQSIQKFLSSKDAILWLATETSMEDKVMSFMQNYGLYKAVVDNRFRFIVLQPQEYLQLRLPTILDAYTPLKEDAFFIRRVESTLVSIAKKISRSPSSISNPGRTEQIEGVEIGFVNEVPCCSPDTDNESNATPETVIPVNVYNVTVTGNNNVIQVGPQNQVIRDGDGSCGEDLS